MNDLRPALRDRCPIDLAILSRWFLEHDDEVPTPACADAASEVEEVAA